MCNSELTRRMSCIHQEHALWLLKKRVVNKEWDKIMGPYWNSLPEQGTLNTKETFPRNSLSLLQDDSMVCRSMFTT